MDLDEFTGDTLFPVARQASASPEHTSRWGQRGADPRAPHGGAATRFTRRKARPSC